MKKVLGKLRKPIAAREWQWPSREAAEEAVRNTLPWKTWDEDIRKTFMECGMVHSFRGSELKVPAFIDAIGYSRLDRDLTWTDNGPALSLAEAYYQLPEVCKAVPVHFIYGGLQDFVPRRVYTNVIKNCGAHVQTVHEVVGGHLIIHENPRGCAEALRTALLHTSVIAKM
ncbi:hypothetical protein QCA50_007744 [Cerrena zonata]|uniref:Serine hydrolase FSH domain-containing protein n=1 Tax=Cerrena zonata TaxID=2478898 RepID=A0AAW0G6S9_9APHY